MQSTLVIAEHNNETLGPITQNSITAAKQIGYDVTVLVAGTKCGAVASSAAKLDGVKRVIVAEGEAFKGFLPEAMTPLILAAQAIQFLAYRRWSFGSRKIFAASTCVETGCQPDL